jgi:hypothetical protein
VQLKKRLENKNVDEDDTNHIVHHMFANRTRYSAYVAYSEIIIDSIKSLFGPVRPFLSCTCRCKKLEEGSPEYKREKRYLNGSKRFVEEIDLIKILKTIRISKMLFRTTLRPEERLMLQVQRNQVISSDSSDEVLTDNADTINQLDNYDHPLVRCFALGKIRRLLKNFADKREITRTGRQLLLGFYTANKYEINGTKIGGEDDMHVDKIDFRKANKLIKRY